MALTNTWADIPT